MVSEQQLQEACLAFFEAFATPIPSTKMLAHFSTTAPVIIQHAPASCPIPHNSRLSGLGAVRSYFDLLATHWERSDLFVQNWNHADTNARQVVLTASATWTWRKSGRKWTEVFTWTLDFDEGLKIVSFVVRTVSGPGTCVMRAVDNDPDAVGKPPTLTAMAKS